MVDIVARAIAEENNYTLSFKTSEVIFGGGRLTVSKNEIPSDYEQFCELYDEANKNAVKTLNGEKVDIPATGRKSRGKKAEAAEAPAPEETPGQNATSNDEKKIADDVKQAENDAAENAEMNQALLNTCTDGPSDCAASYALQSTKMAFL